jgi:amino acid adenylation domain-containing protein
MTTVTKELSYELTPTQEAMLLYSLYAPGSPAYFEQFCYRYRGSLNIEAFKAAWQQIIDRHPSLRTSFHWADDNARQTVHATVELPFKYLDWRELATTNRDEHLREFLKTDGLEGFDVSKAPLLRIALIQTGECEFYIVISNHHLVIDGWSMGVIRREVSEIYGALARHDTLELPAAPAFSDYVERLGTHSNDAETFWQNELKGFSAPNNLPFDRAPGTLPAADEQFAERSISLSSDLSSRLQAVARKHRLTMSTLLQSAWAVLLSRYCNTEDVVFGITVSGRPYDFPEVDSLVGLLINTLPLRAHVPTDGAAATWLGELQKKSSRVIEHETISLKQLHACSDLPHNVPMFETLVVFENFIGYELKFDDASEIELCHSHLARTNYPLTLVVNPHGQINLRIVYHRSRFADAAIARLLNHLATILESFSGGLDKEISSVDLLNRDERQLLLNEWSGSQCKATDIRPVHQLIEEHAQFSADAVAVEHEGERLTYAELNARAKQLASFLRTQNDNNGLIGICLERSLDMIVSVLAVLKAGYAYVPLDPSYPKERLELMLKDSAATLLVTRDVLRERFPQFNGTVVSVDGSAKAIANQPLENLSSDRSLDDLAYVIYTSGSTGKPKGVMIEHRSLASFVNSAVSEYEISKKDRVLQFASLCFDTSVEEIYCTLAAGATLVLRNDAMLTSGRQFLQTTSQLGITVLDLPTGYWHHLVTAVTEDGLTIPESLRLIILGGEQANADHLAQWLHTGTRAKLLNSYGPTEATVVTTICDLSKWSADQPLAIGRPIRGASVYVLDRALRPVPIGVPGELFIGGAGVARGYFNRPELTAEKFIDNPFGAGKLYRSGDLVRYLSDGNLEFLGRVDNQIKIRGFRIELEEIEQAIRNCGGVSEAIVTAQKDGADHRLCAYIVLSNGSQSLTELRGNLKRLLPAHMLPSTFTVLESLPLMPNGKVDRQTLPAPDSDRPDVEETFVSPRTPTEEVVARIWCKALKLDRVGVCDNFFELGGHSLLAARVFSDLQKKFNVDLNLVDIFSAPTVADLAEMIYRRETEQHQDDELFSLLSELDELTDDEARRRVAEQMKTTGVATL